MAISPVDAKDLNTLALNWCRTNVASPTFSEDTNDDDTYAEPPALWELVGTPLRSSGDANGDGNVDTADLNIVGQNWRKTFASVRPTGDFNGDLNR